jgi:hypothetical protein
MGEVEFHRDEIDDPMDGGNVIKRPLHELDFVYFCPVIPAKAGSQLLISLGILNS